MRPPSRVVLQRFIARDTFSRWGVVDAQTRATATTSVGFLDALRAQLPFPVKAIQASA